MNATTTGVATGTSLEILAPYVLCGIEVQATYDGLLCRNGDRFPLTGIDTNAEYPVLAGEHQFMCPGVLPVLRDFRALTQQLPDGTGSYAVEFVRSFVADQYNMDWSGAHIDKVYDNGDIMVSIPNRHPQRYDHNYVLHSDYAGLPLEAYSWLVKNHFALPVNGKPLVENIDFIPL